VKKASQKEMRWCHCLPIWRRSCAKSAERLRAKLRWLLRYHTDVRKPLSLHSKSFSVRFAQFAVFLGHHLHDLRRCKGTA